MIEAFLINPPKRLKARNPYVMRGGPTRFLRKGTTPGRVVVDRRLKRRNPFGEEVMIVGANPRKRDRFLISLAGKRRTPYRQVGPALKRKEVIANMFDNPRKRRRRGRGRGILGILPSPRRMSRRTKARRRRRVTAAAPIRRKRGRRRTIAVAPVRRRRRRRAIAANPIFRRRRRRIGGVSRRRSRMLRNPPVAETISWRRPMSMLMPAAVGTAGFLLTEKAPDYVGMTGLLPRYGVKAAVMIGGGLAVSRFLGARNGQIWMLGSLINIASDLVRQYIFRQAVAGLGYGAFPYLQGLGYVAPESANTPYTEYGAYPGEFASPYGS